MMTDAATTTSIPPPTDWRELGRTEWLNAKHMPDRMCRIYPTQDRFTPEDEREFMIGWNEAAVADKLAAETTALPYD